MITNDILNKKLSQAKEEIHKKLYENVKEKIKMKKEEIRKEFFNFKEGKK